MKLFTILKRPCAGLVQGIAVAGFFLAYCSLVASTPVPVIHATDLYSPAQDPDDHWDLATQYALACQGKIDLKGIVIDYTRDAVLEEKVKNVGDPDVRAVAQLNHITGLAVPVAIGSRGRIQTADLSVDLASRNDLSAVKFIQKILQESEQPVVIHVTGTARDVALAGHSDPGLFADKCKAIYLNAGLSRNDGKSGEYNVHLDKIGYKAIFDLPCPVYWMPCFSAGSGWHKSPDKRDELYGDRFNDIIPYETFWKFKHGDVFPVLSDSLKRFFTYMYRDFNEFRRESRDPYFLRHLISETDSALLKEVNPSYRHMWCTAGFLHAAGLYVNKNGEIQELDDSTSDAWYTFEPANIVSDETGATSWSIKESSGNRFIFRYFDWDRYNESMNQGFKALLSTLP